MRRSLKWTAAILASGVLHAGAAAWMLQSAPDEVLIEGSATMEIALLGSLDDSVSAGETVEPDVAEPVRDVTETIAPRPTDQPLDAVRTARAETATLAPVAEAVEAATVVPVAPSPLAEAVEPDETLPAQVNLPAEAVEPAQTSDPIDVAVAAAVQPRDEALEVEPPAELAPVAPETPPVETAVAEAVPIEPETRPVEAEAAEVAPTETEPNREIETALAVVPPVARAVAPAEPVETFEEVPLPADAPLPTARPEPPVLREAVVRPKVEEPRVQRRAEPLQSSGSGGRQDRDSRKGQSDGSERASAASSGAGRGGGQAGNASVSNYPGQVTAKLRRTVRSVSRNARRGAQRDVHVAFVVTSDGGLGSVRISQSSGSTELDQAALDSVRRAAPFPPIPAGAGRSSWSFSVPLGLAR
ncbi:MAG: TonB family protein [Mesorhizobium sp.]